MIVVSNSTVFIGLAKIGKLNLLPDLFSKIHIPKEVYKELTERGKKKAGAGKIKNARWIKALSVKDRTQVNFLMAGLDKGESEVLSLAKELNADLILLDDEKARKTAALAGFSIMGIIGILLLSKERGMLKRIRPYLEDLKRKKFRISDRVILEVLRGAGEIH